MVDTVAEGANVQANASGPHPTVGTPPDFFSTFAFQNPRTNVGTQDEDRPRTAALDDGGYVIVWTQSTGTANVMAQRYFANGDPNGGVITVSAAAAPTETQPYVTAVSGGGFAVVYVQSDGVSSSDLTLAIYDGSGIATASATVGGAGVAEINPTVTALSNGQLLVTWEAQGSDTDISGQRFASNGTAVDATPFLIRGTADNFDGFTNPTPHSVTALGSGTFAVTWVEGGDVKVQTFDSSSTPAGGTLQTLDQGTATDRSPDVALLADGRFVVVWESTNGGPSDLWAQVFTAAGAKDGAPVDLTIAIPSSEFEPSVTALADGGYAVSWLGNDGLNSTMDVRLEMFDADGTPRGSALSVTNTGFTPNVNALNPGQAINENDASVTVLQDGRVLLSWVDPDPATANVRATQDDILHQIYDPGTGKPLIANTSSLTVTLPTTFTLFDTDGSETLDVIIVRRIQDFGYGLVVGHQDDGTYDDGTSLDPPWVIVRGSSAEETALLDGLIADPANNHVQIALGVPGSPGGSFDAVIEAITTESDGGATRQSLGRDIVVLFAASNNPPSGADATKTILEDATYTFAAADFGFSDTDGNALLSVKISTTPLLGTLKLSGVTVISGDIIFAGNIPNLTYTPAPDDNGTGYASFTFQVRDNGGTVDGGEDFDPTPNTFTFNVTAVNDAPTITAPGSIGVTEDTASALTGISFADKDAGGGSVTATLSVGVGEGTLAAVSDPGVTVGGSGTNVLTLSGSIANINTFIAASNVTFTTALDQTADVTLNVDIDDAGNTGTDPGDTGSISSEAAATTLTLAVTGVNDAPENTVPGPQVTDEDTPLAITGLQVSDVDIESGNITVTLSVSHGTIHVADNLGPGFLDPFDFAPGSNDSSSVTFSCDPAFVNATLAALNGVVYTPDPNYNGSDTLTMLSDDSGATGTGGPKTDSDPVTITINAVNDAPVVTTSGGKAGAFAHIASAVDPAVVVTDVDSITLASATVAITNNFHLGGDVLSFVNNDASVFGDIGASYDAVNGILSLSSAGASTLQQWQAALRIVSFTDDALVPSTLDRTMTFTVNDGALDSLLATRTLAVKSGTEVIVPQQISDAHDYNGDHTSDILWSMTSGPPALQTWELDGLGGHAQLDYGALDPTRWEIAKTGDVNGDGRADVIWHAKDDGSITTWDLDPSGASFIDHDYGRLDPARWEVAGAGDFNHDGKTDILWHAKNNGWVATWELDGEGGHTAHDYGLLDPARWEIAGLGDFNNDGISDIVWHAKDNGEILTWQLDGVGGHITQDYGALDPTRWEVGGIGDTNADGVSDIIWHAKNNGWIATWELDGAGGHTAHDYGALDPARWEIGEIGQFNGDSRADILWHAKDDGAVSTWELNGTGGHTAHDYGTQPIVWQLIA
jgi:hypothetical protein